MQRAASVLRVFDGDFLRPAIGLTEADQFQRFLEFAILAYLLGQFPYFGRPRLQSRQHRFCPVAQGHLDFVLFGQFHGLLSTADRLVEFGDLHLQFCRVRQTLMDLCIAQSAVDVRGRDFATFGRLLLDPHPATPAEAEHQQHGRRQCQGHPHAFASFDCSSRLGCPLDLSLTQLRLDRFQVPRHPFCQHASIAGPGFGVEFETVFCQCDQILVSTAGIQA